MFRGFSRVRGRAQFTRRREKLDRLLAWYKDTLFG